MTYMKTLIVGRSKD